ncbi:FCD domain-containing protein [Propionimicrobium sp. PCR01-08-3]|uniref:FadR/GntR family transcriptional regulator n=1 Tax=Propionimicrobium sp. PCR01-08-3 TaxID=3052086 RepID=UPI00255CB31A|nr:FCD domain-containing protein [Propionimicrobium sp. PCR01-08-3]WIY83486.1 FCD domain-containing protein [Propionimicrobium sp. PCR01-08-3]
MVGLLPAHERVLVALRQSGLRSGDCLPSEPRLALQLGMSRQSVREALVAMQAIGVVEGRQGARRRLVSFDPVLFGEHLALSMEPNRENLLQTLQVRRVLEHSFLPVAAQGMSQQRMNELDALADSMIRNARLERPFLELDEQFHTMLFAGLRNKALEGFIGGFWSLFRQAPSSITRTTSLSQTAAIHKAIVNALINNDLQLAVHRLDAHFYDVQSRIASREMTNKPTTETARGRAQAVGN